MKPIKKITEKQKKVFIIIKDYIETNNFGPTISELCDILGLKSKSTVHRYLVYLEKKGYIERYNNSSRAIRILRDI